MYFSIHQEKEGSRTNSSKKINIAQLCRSKLLKHLEQAHAERFCTDCNLTFETVNKMAEHSLVVHNRRSDQKATKSSENVLAKQEESGVKEKPLKKKRSVCSICNLTMLNKSNLNRHLQLFHGKVCI